jgi:hypothetical protein
VTMDVLTDDVLADMPVGPRDSDPDELVPMDSTFEVVAVEEMPLLVD